MSTDKGDDVMETGQLTIDVWGPEVESRPADVVERAGFGAHDRRHSLDERIVERRTHQDGLGEGRRIAEVARGREADSRTAGNAVLP